MRNLNYVQSLIEVYTDPGIQVTYYDQDDGKQVVILNDTNGWDSALTDGSILTISVTTDMGSVSVDVEDSSTWVDLSVSGETRITFHFENDSGVSNSVERIVTVSENEIPDIILLGATFENIAIGGTYIESGATVIDEDPIIITDAGLQISGVTGINTGVAGTYAVYYNYTDTGGLGATTEIRIVNVFDNAIGPTITISGSNPLNLNIGDEYLEPGAGAQDVLGNDLTVNIIIEGDVDTSQPGTYSVVYSVIDSFGAKATETRVVEVADYPDLEDTELSASSRPRGSDVYQNAIMLNATYSKDLSLSNFADITDDANLLQNVYNIIFTEPNERFFNPRFGSRINLKTFDLISDTTEQEILDILKEDIERFEPRVFVLLNRSFVEIVPNERKYTVLLSLILMGQSRPVPIAFTRTQ